MGEGRFLPCFTLFVLVCVGTTGFSKCQRDWHFPNMYSDGVIRTQASGITEFAPRWQPEGSAGPGNASCSRETSAPPSGPALETVLSIPRVPMFQFLLLRLGKERRGDTPRHSTLCTHPHDSARVTQMAQSTGRNRSVPNGPAAPSPRCPSLGPTMRPCAAPAARPGIWRRDRGNSRQIFKTEPREQSRPLCTEEAAS